jgi:hypothetical protein
MKRPFFRIASLVLILTVGGGLVWLNTKPVYSDSDNVPIKVGEVYFITSCDHAAYYKILAMPNSSGWTKAVQCKSDRSSSSGWQEERYTMHININNAFMIVEGKAI